MRNVLTTTAVLVAGLSFATQSNAEIFIGLQETGVNGGVLKTMATDTVITGFANFAGKYGVYTINAITASTPPASVDPLDSTAMNISSATPGELKVFVSATDVPLSGAPQFLSSLTSNTLPTGWTAHLSTYWDAGNTAYATTSQIGDQLFKGIGGDIDLAIVSHSGLISVTGIYDLTSNGSGTALSTLHVETIKIPEPSSLFLLGASLTMMGMFAHRLKAKSRA